ncbi:hypothetical protein OIU84_027438 [Salix udensis]|uniref:Uncharacterized protein n=1 Tax=Salix udensis TaxID=889485 RepID=A0AAD6PBJ5_9ROSI|nr:hypothetical protein OIU84_027438 [Salix udensis]
MMQLFLPRLPCQWSYHHQCQPPLPQSLFHHHLLPSQVQPHFVPSWIAPAVLRSVYRFHPAFLMLVDMDRCRQPAWM